MFSAEKERVQWVELVDPVKKNVEDWMGMLFFFFINYLIFFFFIF